MKTLLLSLFATALSVTAQVATPPSVLTVTSLPATCSLTGFPELVFLTTGNATGLYQCLTTNTWTLVGGSGSSGWSNNYIYRRTITINGGTLNGETLTNFPVTFTETNNNFRTVANGGFVNNTCTQPVIAISVPCDFIFTSDAAGTVLLNWECAFYSATTGQVECYVKVPSATEATVIYLYYDKVSVNTWQGGTITGVWDSNFDLVMHLKDGTTLSAVDSTTKGNGGTTTTATATAGQIDGGANFAKTSANVISGPDTSFPASNTARLIEFWANLTTLPTNPNQMGVFEYGTRDFNKWWGIGVDGRNASKCAHTWAISNYGGSSCGPAAVTGAWHHLAIAYTTGVTTLTYLDGVLTTTDTFDSGSVATVLRGSWQDNNNFDGYELDAKLDEIRVSTTARTAGYVSGSYNGGNHTLYTLGAQDNGSGSQPVPPTGPYNAQYGSAVVGAVFNTNLASATANGVDYTTAINTFLAKATAAAPVRLTMDGATQGGPWIISNSGNTTIEGIGTGQVGLYEKVGINDHGVKTASFSATTTTDPGAPAPAYTGGDVTLKNFFINGNAQGPASSGANHNERGQITPQVWEFCIALADLQRIYIEGMRIYDCPTYGIMLRNTKFIDVHKVTMTVYDPSRTNHDVVHLDGPFLVANISDIDALVGDDIVALNSDEGNATTGGQVNISRIHSFASPGNIGSLTFLRLHGDATQVYDVTMSQLTGQTSWTVATLGADQTAIAEAVTHFVLSDSVVTPKQSMLLLSTNVGDVTLSGVTWYSPVSGGGNSVAWVQSTSARALSNLTINSGKVYRDGGATSPYLVQLQAGATIDKLTINGYEVSDKDGSAYAATACLINQNGGTIGEIVINAINTSNITALVCANFTGITKVSGAGVLATGWGFPDSVMMNGVPYYSSNALAVRIKLGGTAGGVDGTVSVLGGNPNPVTVTNCTSSASPAVCGSAAAGSIVIAATATTVIVNTTAVTANSQIFVTYDSSLGTKLGVTCNVTEPALYGVTARTAATSFTITATAPITNPVCMSFLIVN